MARGVWVLSGTPIMLFRKSDYVIDFVKGVKEVVEDVLDFFFEATLLVVYAGDWVDIS